MSASGGSDVCMVWLPDYNLRLELELPSSGVIIDFHLTGIRTLRSSPLGRQAAKILGKLGPEKFLMAGRGHLGWTSSHRSCQEQTRAEGLQMCLTIV